MGRLCRQTFETLVSDLEVGLEVVVARPDVVEVVVEDSDAARPTCRAVTVQYVNHVDGTVDVAEVFPHAPADAHPAVARMRDHQHLADAASHPEVLRLTVRMLERRHRSEFPVYDAQKVRRENTLRADACARRSLL